ncbi:PaaI family thioesterase [Oceanobacillus sp. CFH 90083]|uniref:PaaI family thioesterase n=1 Tax=Oceanobacillus sp. CFH 90083 TaxID=2592336 RepID=UPI00128BE689|nr:PaaI family thioesterase [Oceanobacillus sp. CFH 90083]
MSKIFHGGAIISLVDTPMGIAARSIEAEKVSTIQLEVRFIKPVQSGVITTISKIKYEQKSTCIIECQVKNTEQELIALGTSTFKKN